MDQLLGSAFSTCKANFSSTTARGRSPRFCPRQDISPSRVVGVVPGSGAARPPVESSIVCCRVAFVLDVMAPSIPFRASVWMLVARPSPPDDFDGLRLLNAPATPPPPGGENG